ncbi:MAG: tRNA dihydrouridine(20/20a) synthase DusA [Geminicoccaceae bacterium]|nr:MAG: tRNA dihydrouridine(20/20a) synthase DusA [Geminicoccaceae bacterium]
MPRSLDHRFCVAPMMDWTDRHCRFFHRLLAPRALLFSEMVTTGAIRHGPTDRLLAFDAREQPVILQLGGSEPDELAAAIRTAEAFGYAGYDLNCGCPSDRVQKGRFGACLMAEPERVRDCLSAMREATAKPLSVKSRIGIDDVDEAPFLERFVTTVAEAGIDTFVIHARKAWLQGLSPKQNREVPPLRYALVEALQRHHPELRIVLNGGLRTPGDVARAMRWAKGVMIGREAYQNPASLPALEAAAWNRPPPVTDFTAVVAALADYVDQSRGQGVPAAAILRHTLGLFNGRPGARLWRRTLSDEMRSPLAAGDLVRRAAAPVLERQAA